MPKKVKNNLDDNFDFDTGGMTEFFPLEKPSKGSTPPKGTKGYLKNVAKSVLNLGVRVNKHLYPETFELAESIGIGSDNENRVNVKGILNNVNSEIKKWSGVGKDVVKEVVKDTKEAVKTGYFIKSEDESMDMSAAFGDIFGDDSGFDFGSDSVSFDGENNFSLDDSDFGTSDSGDSYSGAKINFGEAIVKSEYASTKAILSSNAKMMNSSLSATQAHIKNERLIFAQQMTVMQEHHIEKMKILKNIASNIGKNIEQGNISLRAQMEYSAKSLAFAQDTAAMIKEMRDSIWSMTTPKKNETTPQKSMFNRVFGKGSSLNIKEWGKFYKQNTKAQAGGGIFDMLGMLPEAIGTMTEMGMSPAQAIKSLGGGMLMDSITDAFIGSGTRKKINAFNVGMSSLPGAINAKLGELSDSGKVADLLGKIPLVSKLINKYDKNGKVADILANQASYAHMYDNSTVLSDKYMMGDPDAVHPFDNKAHKVLTEVIPYQLSEINAGVNHKEAEYFDFKLNKFMPKSYMKTITEQNERNVIKGNFGYSEIENEFSSRVANYSNENIREDLKGLDINSIAKDDERKNDLPFYDSNGQLITEMITSEFDRMLANYHKFQLPWNKKTVNKLKSDSEYADLILIGTSLELASDKLKKTAIKLFADTLVDQMTITDKNGNVDYEKAERNRYLRAGGLSYASDLTEMYSENEDRFAGMGSSIDYYSQMRGKDNKRELEKAENLVTKMEKRYSENHSAANLKKLQEARQAVIDLKQAIATTGYSNEVNANINKGFDVNSNSDFDFNNFRIKSLEDSSQYGLIQNIYNLLLSGIDVYTKNEQSEEHKKFLSDAQKAQGKNKQRSISSMNSFQKSTEYQEVGLGRDIKEALKDDGKDEEGKTQVWRMSDDYRFLIHHHYKYYEFDDKSGKYKPVSGTNFDDNKTYYKRVADINADNTLTAKEQKMERSDSIGTSFIQKIPGLNKVYDAVNNVYGGATSFASKFIGQNFYGEYYGKDSYQKDFADAKKATMNKANEVKDKATEIKDKAKETGRKIKTYTTDVKNDAKEFNEEKHSGIDTGIHIFHRLSKDLDSKVHFSELPGKIKKKIENIRKSDESLYDTLKTEFGEDKSIFKMIDKLSEEEKKIWNDFKDNPDVEATVSYIIKKKTDTLDKIKESKAYKKLSDEKKLLFDKLVTKDRKATVNEWKENITGKIQAFKDKYKVDDKLNDLLSKGESIKDSIMNKADEIKDSDLAKSVKGNADKVLDTAKRYKDAIDNENVKETFEKEDKDKFKSKFRAIKGIFRREKEDKENDGIINSSSEMKEDRENKKQIGYLASIAAGMTAMKNFFTKADKDGLNLSKDTMKEIDESNKEAAEQMSDSVSGSDGLISSLLNKFTGGKFGDIVGKAGNAGSLLTKAGGALSGMGGSAAAVGSKLLKVGGSVSSAAGAAGSMGLSSLAGAGAKAKGLVGKVGEIIKKIFDAIFKKGGGAVKKAGGKARDALIKNISKFAPKLGGKLAAVTAASAAIIAEIAAIVIGFTKGMYKAKEYFKVGKGMRITFGMRMAAGLADALDAGLMGIPGLIAHLLGKPSLPLMFYDWCGGDAEKDALVRYQKFNRLRARILGVADPDKLVAFENRSQGEGVGGTIKNGLNKGFRAIGNFLTGGMMMNNDEKDASMLGFQTLEIYRKWKGEKYDPIDKMREETATEMGLKLKDVEDVDSGFITDENDDGEIDENDTAAQQYLDALKQQATYRVNYLKKARDFVKEAGLEWLTTTCTAEEFTKQTGKSAGDNIVTSKGERFKQGAKTLLKRAVGISQAKTTFNIVKTGASKIIATTKKIKEKVEELYKKYKFDQKTKDIMDGATAAIQSIFKRVDPGYGEDGKINDDNPKGVVGTDGANTNSDVINVGQNGGPGFAAGEGFFVRTTQQPKQTISNAGEALKNKASKVVDKLTNTYDLSGRTPKAVVMNSIADDFAKNFGNELNKKLDILKEIQEENLRHHGVAEDFFAATLQLLAQMAKSSGNAKISSRLDSMVREVTSM